MEYVSFALFLCHIYFESPVLFSCFSYLNDDVCPLNRCLNVPSIFGGQLRVLKLNVSLLSF